MEGHVLHTSGIAARDSSSGTVVIVDDQPAVLRGLGQVLQRCPYSVAAFCTPHEAIAKIVSGNVVVVVSDIVMPEMSGIELLRTIRQYDPDLPVVLFTGKPDIKTAAAAIEYGAFKYLLKPVDADVLADTVHRAARLYRLAQAKRQALAILGKPTMEAERAGLEASFERALNRMWIAFQPIVRASDTSIFGYEALLRSDELLMMSPVAMLDAAQRLGALNRLGRAIRERAAKAMAMAHGSDALFVNVLPQDLLDPELYDEQAALTSIAGRVILEITERVPIADVENVRARISVLRERGFRIAIDDLGAGYAGLSSFALLEPEFVKLDMALVRGIDTAAVKQELVATMTALCSDMGQQVVAEGVETDAERGTLVELGCDLLQGYLYARPGPPFPKVNWQWSSRPDPFGVSTGVKLRRPQPG
jgi:EAL domain-containing protein (putative c-di-GMP-specific phosphodiesterase class I)